MSKDRGKRSSKTPVVKLGNPAKLLADLANMRDDGIPRFRKRWHRLYRSYDDKRLLALRDELRVLWTHRFPWISPPFEDRDDVVPLPLTERVEWLQTAQDVEPRKPLEQIICEHWLAGAKNAWVVEWAPARKRIRANPVCLPAVLAWSCVHFARKLGCCRNRDCPARYFLARRIDQKYCSDVCAAPAKRAAKLKWWREHRRKTPVLQGRG